MKSCALVILLAALAAAGKDPCFRRCDRRYAPVCSTDGRTLPNQCQFGIYQCQQRMLKIRVAVAHEGECTGKITGCPTVCPEIWAPVCGSDGKTYDTECRLEAASCRAFQEDGTDIHFDHEGPCVAAAPQIVECPIVCPAVWAPVCGSNGKTYTNKCRLEVASCRSLQQDGPAIELKSEGVCKEPRAAREEVEECPIVCPAVWAPVCGSNGKTYTNKCRLEVASCRSLQQDGPAIELKSEGVCGEPRAAIEGRECMKPCPKIFSPVCASNGQTFGSKCYFEIAQCNAAKNGDELVLVHDGPCK